MRRTIQWMLVALLGFGICRVEAQSEEDLVAVLQSDAGLDVKMDACVQLGRIGTEKCVPVLAALLGDKELSHMARYALEPIPSPAVDVALRNALDKLQGRELIGVIGSIGVRRDAAAVGALAGFLDSSDPMVIEAAARALGSIGTEEAAEDLKRVINRVPASSRWAIAEGLFRCAKTIAAEGKKKKAVALYDFLRAQENMPHQVRTGALRGAVLARGAKKGLPLLRETLHSHDFLLFDAACRTAMELPGKNVTPALAAELKQLSGDEQVVLASVLGKRGDKQAVPALLQVAQNGSIPARVAAIRAVAELNDPSATSALVKLWKNSNAEVAKAAEQALAAQQGRAVDAEIMALLKDKDIDTRCAAIELLGRRRTIASIPALLKVARSGDRKAAGTSLRVLGDLAGMAELPDLIALIVNTQDKAIRKAAEAAASAVCLRLSQPKDGSIKIVKALYGDLPNGKERDVTAIVASLVAKGELTIKASNKELGGDPAPRVPKQLRVDYTVDGIPFSKTVREKQSLEIRAEARPPAEVEEMLCSALEAATGEARLALMRVMRFGGGQKAFDIVKKAATNGKGKIRDEAVSILSGWNDPAALPTLLEMAKNADSERTKILALRGCCRLLPLSSMTPKKKFKYFNEIMKLADRPDEKKLALSALGSIHSVEALKAAKKQFTNSKLAEEACLAAVQIGEQLPAEFCTETEAVMKAVVKTTKNAEIKKSARKLLNKYRSQ